MTIEPRAATPMPDFTQLCHYDAAGDYGTHRAYHLGEPCPYDVVNEVINGRPDPRGFGVEWVIPVDMSTGKASGKGAGAGSGRLVPPLTLNGSRGMNPMAHAAKVKMIRTRTRNYLREAAIPMLAHVRVELHLRPSTNAVRDRDNLVATLKPCMDAMQPDALERWDGIVAGDDPRYVSWVPPMIHRAVRNTPAAMWLLLTTYPTEAENERTEPTS